MTELLPGHYTVQAVTSHAQEPPPKVWTDWRNGHYATGIVIDAVIANLCRLDAKHRSPLDPLWTTPRLCCGRVRNILTNLMGYALTGDFRKGRKASAQWQSTGSKYRKRKYMQPIGVLCKVVRNAPLPAYKPWAVEQLIVALGKLNVTRTELDRLETKWRMEDFTNGRAREVTDPDLPFACMAAFEGGGGWSYAASLAQRGLADNT